ncbi:MAG TPA: 1-deoxy-D-xylulose-5-phosphate reductoisomerase [Syntrophales bacterium]|nr:1-deoxy-D-xylulose-5-phosphate reductoisomerase [Syntrophales bacterium]
MKKIAILGSTGSIGVSALDVVSNHPERLEVVALAAGRNLDALKGQIERFRPQIVSVLDKELAGRLRAMLGSAYPPEILWGDEGVRQVASAPGADMVLSAIVGAAGLVPTLAAIEAGKDIALANKETLVTAGSLVVEKARAKGVRIIPVDSEHSAVFQCLEGARPGSMGRVILTASGGPFLRTPREELGRVRISEALHHPNWKMGRKITIDSATMMNKGLEVIEAHWLFGVDYERIDVVIHPQSIIHSLVEFVDGSMVAQMGLPDMRGPISYALFYPVRTPGGFPPLQLSNVRPLEFLQPDLDRFPCLRLGYEAGRAGGTMPTVMNAANEVAVSSFLEEKVSFSAIARIIEGVMLRHSPVGLSGLEAVLSADSWARREAEEILKKGIG